ncbi:RHS repeat-associated core domain-containing protein [Streptomyces sp. NBC_00287]|uniref:RHS repeat-associated core domain-containing protein n=1 Tax=Streptomyces sp. NBC_00287 TaxID=2975702 RepID=UPI002E2B8574|nr:RHS repeat-associated core domain-containing protein [Streptomyces sp. NBC_00287]
MAFGIGTSRRREAARHRTSRLLATSLALALVAPLGLAQVAEAKEEPGGLGRPDVPESRVSKVKTYDGPGAKKARQRVAKDKKANAAQAEQARADQKAAWPKNGEATLKLTGGKTAKAAPGGVPVAVNPLSPNSASSPKSRTSGDSGQEAAASGDVRITVLDQKAARKAGITGVLLTAEADTAGTAEVSVDYSAFASAVGGDWSQRLRLVQLPACVLTTPQKAECREQQPLTSGNDTTRQSVSAQVDLSEAADGTSPQLVGSETATASSATVLAVTAAAAGSGQSPSGTGDYSATPLSASSEWQAGGNSGSFTWSYGFTMPPAAAGPAPGLSLSYDSGSVDGRTSTTNNQGTSIGEGFSLTESYIERSYGSCDDDGHADVFDRCWKYDNASLVLNGKSTRLVRDDASGQWKLADDDASQVTRSTGADNGDNNGEYWTVVSGDGTKYVFGLNKLDGADTQRTNSTWTVPVFGDDADEPGYSAGDTFGDRSVTQAWRWNLDYVEDTHGNAATYWYTKESNHYKKNKATTADASYIRGGYLTRIEYGLRKGALFTDKADAKVTLGHAERCTASDCSSLTEATSDNWPDVPFDAICTDGDTECNAAGPSFFSRKRVTSVNTYSYNATSDAYDPVDSWDLIQQYLDGGDIGDSSDQTLTLKSIKRTGKAGDTSIALNPVSFTYQMRPNRVDATDDILPLTRPRISTVTTETGGITTVTLSSPECVRSQVLGAAEDTNTRSCYPQYWNINGAEEASVDWFHKYRVLAVGVADPTAGNEMVEHAYDYSGAAWHHSDDPFTPKDERTWSDWRGYRKVTAFTGATSVTRSKTVSLYMQGMHGDKNKDGTTKTVTVDPLLDTDVDFTSATDSDYFKGALRQQVTYNGSQPVSTTFKNYTHKNMATQTVPDAADHVARWVRDTVSYSSTYLTSTDTWRTHVATKRYDSLGMVYAYDDYGQKGLGSDETCTLTWYARNTDVGITSLVSRTRTVARECSITDSNLTLPANSDTRGDVLSDTAIVYDSATATSWSSTQKPTKGEATWIGRATGYAATADLNGDRLPSGWQTTAKTKYDTLGRPLSVTNTEGDTSSTEYTPTDAGPLTKTITTDPKLYKAVSFLDPRRGLTLRSYDINLKKTELNYDALGRLTEVWLPNRIRGSQAPNSKFAYHLDNTKPSWVSTSALKRDGDTYNTSYALFDSLLRPLQTQSPTPQGGRLLTDTRYDTRGHAYETYADIFDTTTTPNGTYTRAEYGEAPMQNGTVFDGAGRPTTSTLHVYGVKKWSTTTSYTGDSVATTALEGGSAQRTITDIRGRTMQTRQYATESPADTSFGTGPGSSYATTKFTYALDGQQKSITGPDNAQWTYTYDLFGRQVSATDPDSGTTLTEYDQLDRPVQTTDARNTSIVTGYDELGRVTGTWKSSKADANQLTGYTYDTILKGLPTSSTRYVGGKTGQAYTQTVTAYDSLNRATHTQLELPADDPFVKADPSLSTLAYETYFNIDGTQQYDRQPAMGGLPSETIGFTYDGLGNVASIGGSTGYLREVSYSALSQPQLLTLGTGGTGAKDIYVSNRFEEGTGRLLRSHVTDQSHPYMLQDLNYRYDQSGNVTAITDPTTLGGSSSAETQCFAYDGYQRLIEAWTPSSQDCSATRSASALSGPAPYWTSYTYNDAGQRLTETQHGVGVRAGQDTERAYTYPPAGEGQPHTLSSVSTTGDGTRTQSFSYDDAGNTERRTTAVSHQYLRAGWKLTAGQEVRSQRARMVMENDGDLVIYDRDTGKLRWHTNTGGNPGAWATMQDDGNFVVYSATGTSLWSTNTAVGAGSGHFATLQDGGSFAVYDATWKLKWTAGSWIGTAPVSSGTHAHTWDDEGHLATSTAPNNIVTSYLYDTSGNLLIRATENGERVLYAGATELHLRADGTTWAQRYYAAGGVTAALRSNESGTNTLTYLTGDHHGTSTLAITPNTTQTFTRRHLTPFGADRGAPDGDTTTWPDDKGFLGKTRDTTTGLTHIGAREYDPTLGQFISVDPLLETDKPQTLNGYSYAAQNPLTFSDPTGMGLACGGNGDSAPCPTRPDGSEGNGRPNEAVDYTKPKTPHPCNSNCGTADTSNADPTPAPSPGPDPVPGPYNQQVNDPPFDAFKWLFDQLLPDDDPHLMCNEDGSFCGYVELQENAVPWAPGPGWLRPLSIGKGVAGLKEFAARALPEFIKNKTPTVGVGTHPSGHIIRIISGNKKADAALIGIVNDRLRKAGALGTANSARAADAEQKMAAVMIRDGVEKADIFINNPAGPCSQPLGCHKVLPMILGERQLTVHWPDGMGGWKSNTYGGAG